MILCSHSMLTEPCGRTVSLRFTRHPRRSEERVDRLSGAVVATILFCASLSGCIVLPVPVPTSAGPLAASRTNLGTRVPDSMVIGQTTRTQLLLALGEPDGRATDDSWFVYGAVERRGGLRWAWVAAVGAGYGGGAVGGGPLGNWDTSRRLTIRFDENGIVSDASIEQRNCSASRGDSGCVDIVGGDISARDEARRDEALRVAAGSVVAVYDHAQITQLGIGCEFSWRAESKAIRAAPLEIRERALYWRSRDPRGREFWTEIALGDIRAVRPLERHILWRIPVEKHDGSCALLTVFPHHGRARQDLEAEVRSVIAGRVESLPREPDKTSSSASE